MNMRARAKFPFRGENLDDKQRDSSLHTAIFSRYRKATAALHVSVLGGGR